MARRRMIDPNFWQSDDVSKLSIFERLLFIGMFSFADDFGKGRANPAYLRSTIFPCDNIKILDVEKGLEKITKYLSVQIYEVDNTKYYWFKNWKKWQRVDHPQPSIIPNPIQEQNKSYSKNNSENHSKNETENNSRTIPESFSPNIIKDNIKEININKENITRAREYSIFDIIKVCQEENKLLYRRHINDADGDLKLAKILEETQILYSLNEIRKMLKKANKTFICKQGMNCDLVWCLKNFKRVMSEEEIINEKKQINEKDKNSSSRFNNYQKRDYSAEELNNLMVDINDIEEL